MPAFSKSMTKKKNPLKFKNFSSGFTLIELLVALAVFMFVLTIVISIFMTSVKNQRQVFMAQNLQDNARYLLEAIGKEVKMSSFRSSSGQLQTFQITNQEGNDVDYQFSGGAIWREETGGSGSQKISSSQVMIDGQFYVVNEAGKKPRVTIVMRVYPASASQPEIRIQSTISSRSY